jgi:hypothetical protein
LPSDTGQSTWYAEDIPALIAEANAHKESSEDDHAQHPDDDAKEVLALPPGWDKIVSDEGEIYYENA